MSLSSKALIDEFVQWLSPQQKKWFLAQSPQAQAKMAGQLAGSGMTASDVVQQNGGPADETPQELPSMD
ncbi:hypothetical protein [Streptomyces sp. NPDC093707]|uniref:hypothetical protein n=1 Tax=Streptomyces sp. NPDC093707 TaxID=3154984 RepID=UPI00344C9DA3